MNKKTRPKTTDAIEIIDELFFKGRPEMQILLKESRRKFQVAEKLRDLREEKGLSQQDVANRAGTQRSVIARLEHPGYDKHTMSTLRKVSHALGYSIQITFVPHEEVLEEN